MLGFKQAFQRDLGPTNRRIHRGKLAIEATQHRIDNPLDPSDRMLRWNAVLQVDS